MATGSARRARCIMGRLVWLALQTMAGAVAGLRG
jgi:hypothetical protein